MEQLKENPGCLSVKLGHEQLRRLDEISRVSLGFPHDFLANPEIRNRFHSGMYEQIDIHRETGYPGGRGVGIAAPQVR